MKPEEALTHLIDKYGSRILNQPKLLRALMKDLNYPANPGAVIALYEVVNSQMHKQINDKPIEHLYEQLAKQRGIERIYSKRWLEYIKNNQLLNKHVPQITESHTLKKGHKIQVKEIKNLNYTCKIKINNKTTIFADIQFSNNPFKRNKVSQVYFDKELIHTLTNEVKIEYADWNEDNLSWKVTQSEPERLSHHINKVRVGCFSPDSKYIATGSDDCSVKLWDLDGNCISTSIGHTALVSHLQFIDETVLLSASNDGTIILRDIKEKKRMQIQAHSSYITAVDYSSERGLIVTASEDRTVAIWTLHGKKISQIESNGQLYTQIKFLTTNTKLLIALDYTGGVSLLNIYGQTLDRLQIFESRWASLEVSKTTLKIYATSTNGELVILKTANNLIELLRIKTNKPLNRSIQVTAQLKNDYGYSKISFNYIKLYNTLDREVGLLIGHQDKVWKCIQSPDGMKFLTVSSDKTAKLWNTNGECLATMVGHNDAVRECAFSPDGTKILTIAYNCNPKVWDADGNFLFDIPTYIP